MGMLYKHALHSLLYKQYVLLGSGSRSVGLESNSHEAGKE
jgi:hypothetical protein